MTATTLRDPRRSFMVNGAAYRRELNRKPEPDITLTQSLIAGVVVAAFALAVLALAYATAGGA
ncbi:hypothetical protein FJ959_09060 [Mesorhizobium sp. B2-2-4]|uniref:hypothetical protein n=1 Tax=unclassified Mesorhizobium TaxID=325217 RepID=UPI0011288D18|nr:MULTISPECIES: hypothetical protein [unclassified Mesorhizobium]TPM59011.1 hypothetical protein FJ959_09060 [Mesorhizobium sp. B2-2-4]TPM67496.1 hypothetical protein FJ965_10200 [Mesorhizobium sp. B2-2-1]